ILLIAREDRARGHDFARTLYEQRGPLARHRFSGWTSVGEVVEGDRFSGHAFRARESLRVPVERPVRDVEDDGPVVNRRDLPHASGHVGRPELQVTAVLVLPVTVQIYQDVQPSIQRKRAMAAEFCVDPKLAAPRALM